MPVIQNVSLLSVLSKAIHQATALSHVKVTKAHMLLGAMEADSQLEKRLMLSGLNSTGLRARLAASIPPVLGYCPPPQFSSGVIEMWRELSPRTTPAQLAKTVLVHPDRHLLTCLDSLKLDPGVLAVHVSSLTKAPVASGLQNA